MTGVQTCALPISFDEWIAALRVEAIALGISEATLAALDQIEPVARVLELDNSQPEFVQTFTRYLGLRVTAAQIERGQSLLRQHAALLEEVRERYGVQPHYLAAFWAIESNFGRNTGGDRKSTRLNSSHVVIPYAVFCLKKKTTTTHHTTHHSA